VTRSGDHRTFWKRTCDHGTLGYSHCSNSISRAAIQQELYRVLPEHPSRVTTKNIHCSLVTNILFNSFINPVINWGSLSNMMLSGRPCSFHILSLNNLANSFADVLSVVSIKYTIFVSWSTTTRIESYP